MKEILVNTGGCIQNNCLDVLHCIIKVSELMALLFHVITTLFLRYFAFLSRYNAFV